MFCETSCASKSCAVSRFFFAPGFPKGIGPRSVVVELHAAAARDERSRSYVRRTPEHGVLHRVARRAHRAFELL